MHAESITYVEGTTELEGYLAYDETRSGPRPGILVVHDWMGVGPYVEMRCGMLAELGFVAFGADVYGKGVRPVDAAEARKLATEHRADRPRMRRRLQAGLEVLSRRAEVDASRLAAIGYCFGGGAALELARSGADLRAVVSFHGNLDTPDANDAKAIRAKVLVLHGADDPAVPPAQVEAFQAEMRAAQVDWQMVFYGGAVHAFTNRAVGDDVTRGAAYDARADRRSWEAMQSVFREAL